MSEDTQASTETTDVKAEPSLDDVISEYNVNFADNTPPPQQPVHEPVAPQVQVPTKVDFLDEASSQQYLEAVNSGQSALSQQLNDLKTQLTDMQQERVQGQIEADVTKAVDSLNENLNLNPKAVRVYLEMTAQEKPGFKKLWDNRHDNPQAFEKALQAVGREMRDTFHVKQDEGLAETQAAIQQSQQSLAGKPGQADSNPLEEKLANASDAEFEKIWQQTIHGGF